MLTSCLSLFLKRSSTEFMQRRESSILVSMFSVISSTISKCFLSFCSLFLSQTLRWSQTSFLNFSTRNGYFIYYISQQSNIIFMGNLSVCGQNCYLWGKNYDDKMKALYRLYKNDYTKSIYGETCLQLLKQFKTKIETGDELFGEDFNQRKSLIDSLHYEEESMKIGRSHLPKLFSEMNDEEKTNHIEELIKKTYMILDLSDVFEENQQLQYYNSEIKKQLFANERSFLAASISSDAELEICKGLKRFDPHVIRLLQDYVQFSNKVKDNFQPTNYNFLSRLTITTTSRLINLWKQTQKKTLDLLFSNLRTIIQILYQTVLIGFGINIETKVQEQSECVHYNFYTETNIWTLVSALVFEDENFNSFIHKALEEHFHPKFVQYKKNGCYQNSDIIDMLKKNSGKKKKKDTLAHLFDPNEIKDNYFQKSINLLNKIVKQPQPILKLKLVAQLQLQILKQFKVVKEKFALEANFARSAYSTICHWLLQRQKENNTKNIISLVIAYTCNHHNYLIGRKGSALTTFIEEIEKILDEKFSNENDDRI